MGTTLFCPGNSCCWIPRTAGRRAAGASASKYTACGLVASAPLVDAKANSVFSVSPGLRPHLRHRLASSVLRAPQKQQFIERPVACAWCVTFGLLGNVAQRLFKFISTPVHWCHGKSSSITYIFPLSVLA